MLALEAWLACLTVHEAGDAAGKTRSGIPGNEGLPVFRLIAIRPGQPGFADVHMSQLFSIGSTAPCSGREVQTRRADQGTGLEIVHVDLGKWELTRAQSRQE